MCLTISTVAFATVDSDTVSVSHKTGKHTLSVIPAAITYVEGVHSAVGLGVGYEYCLQGMPNLSIGLPVMINFSDGSDFYSYDGIKIYSGLQYRSFCAMPGAKLLLGKSGKRIRYGVGGSIFYEYGKKPDLSLFSSSQFDPFGINYSVYGAVINNSLNVYPTQHLAICFNTGIGMAYNTRRNTNSIDLPFQWMDNKILQFTLSVGYRF